MCNTVYEENPSLPSSSDKIIIAASMLISLEATIAYDLQRLLLPGLPLEAVASLSHTSLSLKELVLDGKLRLLTKRFQPNV